MDYQNLNILAFMSGSSLDGMDLGLINIRYDNNKYVYSIIDATTILYDKLWAEALKKASTLKGEELIELDFKYAEYCAGHINKFITSQKCKVDLISYHGHTIFHNPSKNYTYALGNLATISSLTSMKTIGRYRDSDISLKGQGAPLMAIADELLFPEYKININLGGICNISVSGKESIAYDMAPCNQLLNFIYHEIGITYDDKGLIASQGELIPSLYNQLIVDDYYKLSPPKSLDNNYIKNSILPLLQINFKTEDKLFTIIKAISHIISKELDELYNKGVVNIEDIILITGGGALNDFLIANIEGANSRFKVKVPEQELVNYKELILMALLGFMRVNKVCNINHQATGAIRNTLGGGIYES